MPKRCPKCGGWISDELFTGVPEPKMKCPKCGSMETCKNGKYVTPSEIKQRYLCNNCGRRFS